MTQRSLSRDEVRAVDRRAIEEYGMPGVVLMENAGRGAAEVLVKLGIDGPVVICAGRGNNGGDGFVIARHLENRGCSVRVLLFCDPNDLRGDAAINYRIIEKAGTPLTAFSGDIASEEIDRQLADADWIVDALLGTGANGAAREPYATVIRAINAAGKKVLAIDLPSGLDCDSGEAPGECVSANHTATFVARKIGFDSEAAGEWIGTVHVVDIGVPHAMLE
jgi:NAD(P)H-hydrate epimerase